MLYNGTIKVNGITMQNYVVFLDSTTQNIGITQTKLSDFISSLQNDEEAKKDDYKFSWFEAETNRKLALLLLNRTGLEKDLIAIGMDIQTRKNKMGYRLLKRYLDMLFYQISTMMMLIKDLYYQPDYKYDESLGKGVVGTAKFTGRNLEECLDIAKKSTDGLAYARQEIIKNEDPANLFKLIAEIEDSDNIKAYENEQRIVEKPVKKSNKTNKSK
jgi:hypothetical protein